MLMAVQWLCIGLNCRTRMLALVMLISLLECFCCRGSIHYPFNNVTYRFWPRPIWFYCNATVLLCSCSSSSVHTTKLDAPWALVAAKFVFHGHGCSTVTDCCVVSRHQHKQLFLLFLYFILKSCRCTNKFCFNPDSSRY